MAKQTFVITDRGSREGTVKRVTMTITGVGFQRQIDRWVPKVLTPLLDRRYSNKIRDAYKETHNQALRGVTKLLSSAGSEFAPQERGGTSRLGFYSRKGGRTSTKTDAFDPLTKGWIRRKQTKKWSPRFWRASGDMADAWEKAYSPIKARKTATKPIKKVRDGYRYVTGYEFYGWPELFMRYISIPLISGEESGGYGNTGSKFVRGEIEQAVWLEEGTKRGLPPRPFIRRFSADIGRDLKSDLQRA